jgi:hypothetical protein
VGGRIEKERPGLPVWAQEPGMDEASATRFSHASDDESGCRFREFGGAFSKVSIWSGSS